MMTPSHDPALCDLPVCARCDTYGGGYATGKATAHFELRTWELRTHAPVCGCEPCETVRVVVVWSLTLNRAAFALQLYGQGLEGGRIQRREGRTCSSGIFAYAYALDRDRGIGLATTMRPKISAAANPGACWSAQCGRSLSQPAGELGSVESRRPAYADGAPG